MTGVIKVLFRVERHLLSLYQFTKLISKIFCKTGANSVLQRRIRSFNDTVFTIHLDLNIYN